MAAGIYNFTIEQGATFQRIFKYKGSDNTPIDLSSHAVRMQIRESIDSSSPIISLTETEDATHGSKITVGGDDNNEILILITASATRDMNFGQAVYDLEIELSEVVTRLLQGKVKLSKEVTR